MVLIREYKNTPGFLPGKSQGQRSLVGYSPQGCTDAGKVCGQKEKGATEDEMV